MSVQIRTTDADNNPGGAVGETSGGTKWCILAAGTGIAAYKNIDGTPSQIGSDQTVTTIFGSTSSQAVGIHAAIDSTDVVHVIAHNDIDSDTRQVAYNTITDPDGGSPSWGTWEQVAAFTNAPTAGSINRASISIDTNDKPHVCYMDSQKSMGTTYTQIMYTEKTGASWSTPVEVSNNDTANWAIAHSTFSLKASNNGELYMNESSNNFQATLTSGTWGTPSNLSATYVGVFRVVASLALDSSGGFHEATGDNTSPYEIAVDDTDTGGRGYLHGSGLTKLGIAADTDDLYAFYLDANRDIHLYYNTGSGWTDGSVQQTGTYSNVVVGWSWNNLNNSTSIDYLFSNGTTVWWDEYALTSDQTVVMDQLTLAGSAVSATIVPGAVTQVMDQLTLASSAVAATVVAVVSVVMDQLTLAGAAIVATVVPGAVTIVMTQETLVGAAISTTVDAPTNPRRVEALLVRKPNNTSVLVGIYRA